MSKQLRLELLNKFYNNEIEISDRKFGICRIDLIIQKDGSIIGINDDLMPSTYNAEIIKLCETLEIKYKIDKESNYEISIIIENELVRNLDKIIEIFANEGFLLITE